VTRPGLLDVSARGRLLVRGADRVRFLQGMVTNDVAALAEGASFRAALLTAKGRVVADMLIRAQADGFLMTTEPSLRQKLREALDHYIIMDDVTLEDVTDASAEIALLGSGAAAAAASAGASARTLVAPLGVHVVLPPVDARAFADRLVAAGQAERIDAAAAEVMRIERGVSRYGAEISEDVLPLEAGLDDALSHTKGCYMGQEPVARVTARGHVNKKVVGLVCGALPAPGDRVSVPERPEAGVVTSAAHSPRLGKPIALAFLHRSLWQPGTSVTVGAGTPATVAALPFVGPEPLD